VVAGVEGRIPVEVRSFFRAPSYCFIRLTKARTSQELREMVKGDGTGPDSWVLADVRPEVEFGICKLPGFSSKSSGLPLFHICFGF
jgi:hypothetical protein